MSEKKDLFEKFQDDFEKEFSSTAKDINAKLNQAANLIAEATALANKHHLPQLVHTRYDDGVPQEFIDKIKKLAADDEGYKDYKDYDDEDIEDCMNDMYRNFYNLIDVGNLERSLSDAGWSTSSSYC